MLICSAFQQQRQVNPSTDDTENVTLCKEHITSTSSQASIPLSFSRCSPNVSEFTSSYVEDLQEKRLSPRSKTLESPEQPSKHFLNGCNPYSLPGSPLKLSTKSRLSEGRPVSRWRRQDERSEKSVRDKIAMFSTEKERNKANKNQKIDGFEPASTGHKDKTHMKRSLTEDDVRIQPNRRESKIRADSIGSRHQKKQGKPCVYSSMINVHSSDSDSKENVKPASSETDIRERGFLKNNKANSASKSKQGSQVTSETLSGLHSRSQSLNDIGKSARMKRHSIGAYDRPTAYKFGVEKPEEKERRTSLNNLIEQRRKSISKLRGLVIPEAKANGSINDARLPLDLPKISSHTSQNFKTMSLPRDGHNNASLYKTDSVSSTDSCYSSASRQSNTTSSVYGKGVTKRSPAHSRRVSIGNSNKSDSLPPLSSKKIIDRTTISHSELPLETSKYNDRSLGLRTSPLMKDSRFGRSEDSDNDSAASTQSSFSQSLSPRASPMLDSCDPDDRYSPTRIPQHSRHSSQSSFDDSDPKRVVKGDTFEAENRRNVIRLAKCSSGRSSAESTPEITPKSSIGFTREMSSFCDVLNSDTELRQEGPNSLLERDDSINSFTAPPFQHPPSYESLPHKPKESANQAKSNNDCRVSVQTVYIDKENDVYKESQLKVAYLNEIIDDYEEVSSDRENIFAEIPLEKNNKVTSSQMAIATTPNVEKHEGNKWSVLEHKYLYAKKENYFAESKQFQYSLSESETSQSPQSEIKSKKAKNSDFRALADKWKQRSEEDQTSGPSNATLDNSSKANEPNQRVCPDTIQESRYSHTEKVFMESITSSPESSRFSYSREDRPNTLNVPSIHLPDRKFSVPEYGSNLKLREKRETPPGEVPSRPTSLIESSAAMDTLQPDSQYMLAPLSPSSTSTDSREHLQDSSEASLSREHLLDPSETSLSRAASKELLEAFSKSHFTTGAIPKMSEIMRAFERHDMNSKTFGGSHPRMSSLDSNASDDGLQGAHYGSVSSLASGQRDQYGSITSLSSSTSIISPQELAQLIEEANYSLEESGTPSHEILVVVLHREIVGQGSIGITLAGGADYETKEITVHKVIPGSLADRDGRIQKGDRVLSINGKTLRGVSHREALNILKSPRPEVVMVLSRSRSVTPQESTATQSNGDTEGGGFSHRSVFINHVPPPRPPKILESPMDSKSLVSDLPVDTVPRGPPMNIALVKDGAGLGFSLEGGKDSPLGDRPLTVKKVFSGGAADKEGKLKVGDELLGVNSVDLTNMARIEAWNFLKKLPDGKVSLLIRQKIIEEENGDVRDQSLK